MKEELKKNDPDWKIIRSKMERTLMDRTKLTREGDLAMVLEEYPALRDPQQVKKHLSVVRRQSKR